MLVFHRCDKTPEIINLKGRQAYSGSQFQRVQSMVTWPCCSGLVATQCITAEYTGKENCSPHSGEQESREEEEGLGSQYPLRGGMPRDLTSFQ